MENAIENCSFECLKLLYDKGCLFDNNLCDIAAKYGDVHILKYIHQNCCNLTDYTCVYVAKHGNLEC